MFYAFVLWQMWGGGAIFFEKLMNDVMFELPDIPGEKTVLVTKESLTGGKKPEIIKK